MFKGITLNQLKDKYDVIVIGSGIGGLTCANYLAKAGLSVLVVEQHFQPGGYCTSFERKGYLFDAAAHTFNNCETLQIFGYSLNEIGVKISFDKIYSLKLIFPDMRLEIPFDQDRLEEELGKHFPKQAEALAEYFKRSRKILRSVMRNKTDDPLLAEISQQTYLQYLNQFFDDEMIKNILSFIWITIGDRPANVSALFMIGVFGNYFSGSYCRITGGAQVLSDELCRALTAKDGAVLLSHAIKKINIIENRIDGVEIEKGPRISSKFVVSNADAAQTFFSLVGKEHLPSDYINKFLEMKIGESPYEMYLGVDFPGIEEYEGVYFPENNVNNLMSVLVPSKYDQSIVPENKHSIIATTVFPYQYDQVKDWKACKAEMEGKTLDQLNHYIPGIKDKIEVMESATPKTYYRYTLNSKGSAYGWAHTPDQVYTQRLGNKTPIKGLFLAGHWTQPGGGVQTVLASGKITSRLILEELKNV